ncbi:dynein regulatory complex subunit 2-like isoform X1 [Pimephales promelas]|uniref:dynein regulatory complex subunit 2-like isoform X1 n=2 Tax=Pimephales promelas TaxID=90988 RepID=UPI001955C0E4|nr:dynein regulatory complex subunit 2-like isoform X1 [Pimephales promelas]KAG1945161.1 dynein regulatory complex subunit [Pimephales promelas]
MTSKTFRTLRPLERKSGSDMPTLQPLPPCKLRPQPPSKLRPQPPSAVRPQPLPRLRQRPAPQQHPEEIEMKREITRSFRNTIVLRERSRMSSRGQCVKLPPIPGSSRDDSSNLSQSFERAQKDQDNLIKSMVDELSKMERRSELSRTSHQQSMDSLLKRHVLRLEKQALDFNNKLEELRSEYDAEREPIHSQSERESAYLKDVTFFMEKHNAKIYPEARRDYENSCKQIRKKHKGEYETVETQMKEVIEELREYKPTRSQFWKFNDVSYEKKKEEYDSLLLEFKEVEVDKQCIQELEESISDLECELMSGECQETVQLRSDCVKRVQDIQRFRDQIKEIQTTRTNLATKPVIQFKNITEKLQETTAMGERLLRYSKLCSKMETKYEKVLPFYKSSLSEEELSQVKANAMKSADEELTQLTHDNASFEKFWQRHNKVKLDSLCLKREKELQLQENQRLRSCLEQYLGEGFDL